MFGTGKRARFYRNFVCLLWLLSMVSFCISTIYVLQQMTHASNSHCKVTNIQTKQDFTGTKVKAGTVWPQPQDVETKSKTYVLLPNKFRIAYKNGSVECQEIDDAIARYMRIIFGNSPQAVTREENVDQVEVLQISIFKPCETYPSMKSSERYILIVEDEGSVLVSSTQWGILRGLETFSQLVHRNEEGEFLISDTEIDDFPRFQYRGLMLDTARHFLPVESMMENLEIMAYNKMNVLHWHLTDHQSFPIAFESMPELARNGAFNNETMIYKEDDVRRVVEFARMRGIRVIPEIDFPGHSNALAKSMPHLFIQCSDEDGIPRPDWESMNPVDPEVYKFAGKIYSELHVLFPDEYIHIGGDEVSHACWLTSKDIENFVNGTYMDDTDVHRLMQEGFLQEARKLNLKPIVWDDAFNNGYSKTPATVQAWSPQSMEYKVSELAEGGVDVIVSYPWYLDNQIHKDWNKIYAASVTGIVSPKDQSRVLGGEACMWGEHIDEKNVVREVWPLTSAIAERLWSSETVVDEKDALARLRIFQCVMKTRGVESTPIGPGYCDNIST